jgi:hypothetical protein
MSSGQHQSNQVFARWGLHNASDVHGPASSCGPGQAKPGQSHGLTAALARLTFLESQSRWLLTEIFGTRRAYSRLSNNNFGIISQIIAIFRICPKKETDRMLSVNTSVFMEKSFWDFHTVVQACTSCAS